MRWNLILVSRCHKKLPLNKFLDVFFVVHLVIGNEHEVYVYCLQIHGADNMF